MRRYKRRRSSVGSLGAMTTTSKVLLLTAGVGGAVFLLWRFWPKDEVEEEFVPYEPPLETGGYDPQPLPEEAPPVRNFQATPMKTAVLREGICPPGTALNEATGECYQPPVY